MRGARGVSTPGQQRRNPQRGNSLVLALIVLSALGTLAMLTVVGVRGGLRATANDRFHAMAMYAAESGGAAAMDYLRANISASSKWSAFVDPCPAGTDPLTVARFEANIPGNNVAHGTTGNPFSTDNPARYYVVIYNNRADSGLVAGDDMDARVVIRSTGYGPDGAVAIIEWEVTTQVASTSKPCQVYAQESQSETNSGTNDCIGTIDTGQSRTFTP
ncbi:MAG: hypothetical protein AB7P03_15230 [Kofleriaceae bacterium]